MLTFHLLIYYILPQKDTEILVLVSLFYDDAFLNEVIEKDEIDRLFNKKVLTNVKRYGEKPTSIDNEIVSFDKEKDSLIIKGNNLYRVVFAVTKLTEGWDLFVLNRKLRQTKMPQWLKCNSLGMVHGTIRLN